MPDGRIPLSSYYAEPLGVAQMRGAQLGTMRQQQEQQEARTMAEMAHYGAVDLQDLEAKKMEAQFQLQEQEAKQKQWSAFADTMQDLTELSKQSGGQEIIKGALADSGIAGVISPFVDPTTLKFEGEKGTAFVAANAFPGNIKTPDGKMVQGETVPGKAYRAVGDAETGYFEEVPLTQKMAKTAREKKADPLKRAQAASNLLMKIQGTTTASGIEIDPARKMATLTAISLLHKYNDKPLGEAVRLALEESYSSMGLEMSNEMSKIVAQETTDTATPKTAEDWKKKKGL